MSDLPWSGKGSKSSLADGDEFLILDSADAVLATKNKRLSGTNLKTTLNSSYAVKAGLAGGQTLNGGLAASESLTLDSTAHATKGNVYINQSGGKVLIGTAVEAGSNEFIVGYRYNYFGSSVNGDVSVSANNSNAGNATSATIMSASSNARGEIRSYGAAHASNPDAVRLNAYSGIATRKISISQNEIDRLTFETTGLMTINTTLNSVTMTSAANIAFSGGGEVTGLPAAPTLATSAISKAFFDSQTVLGAKTKVNVDLATTANIVLSGEQNIDGTVTTLSRVLVKDQVDQKTNGIYVTAAGAWARSTDLDNSPSGEIYNGVWTVVRNGTVNSGFSYRITSIGSGADGLHTIGVDNIQWDITDINFVAGDGIDKVGATISVDYNTTNLKITATELDTIQSIATNANPSFNTLASTVLTGTAPFTIASTTKVTNLNADLLDDQSGAYYTNASNLTGTLGAAYGGTGGSSAAATGVPYVSAGVWSYSNTITPSTGTLTIGSGDLTVNGGTISRINLGSTSYSIVNSTTTGRINLNALGGINLNIDANANESDAFFGIFANATTETGTQIFQVGETTSWHRPITDGLTAFQFRDKDANNIFNVDSINNRIGIGNASPKFDLHIGTGSSITTGFNNGIIITSNPAARIYLEDTSQPANKKLMSMFSTSQKIFFASLNDAASAFDKASILTLVRDGNVGIGTSAPDKALEINHPTGACLRLTYNDADGTAANYSDFSMNSAGNLTLSPSGGMIGIGTAVPKIDLHISNATTSIVSTVGNGIVITSSVAPRIYFEDTAQPANKKLMHISGNVQKLAISSLVDAGNAFDLENIAQFHRDGLCTFYELLTTRPTGYYAYGGPVTTGSGLLTTPAAIAVDLTESIDVDQVWDPNLPATGNVTYSGTTRHFSIQSNITIETAGGGAAIVTIKLQKQVGAGGWVDIPGAVVSNYMLGITDRCSIPLDGVVSMASGDDIRPLVSSSSNATSYTITYFQFLISAYN